MMRNVIFVVGMLVGSAYCSLSSQAIREQRQASGAKGAAFFSPLTIRGSHGSSQGKCYHAPSEYIIRDTLIRVKPDALDQALRHWSEQCSAIDESLAIDGKTMRSAIDNEGKQVHIMSAIGHETLNCYTQKKSENSV